jgi:sugar/nucleoside kinase (ribokinase family)
MIEVCVIGELNLDLILYGLPRDLVSDREYMASNMQLTLGSSSAIFAHNLSTLGTTVGFIAKTGDDALGRMAEQRLEDANVDLSRMVHGRTGVPTGVTVVLPHGNGRYVLTYPGTMAEMEYNDLDLSYVRSARHLHVSSFFLHRALRPRMADLFREAKLAGLTTSLDTNDDPEDRWGTDLLEVLKYVDVFLPNEREAKRITGLQDVSQVLSRLAELSTIVVMKRGSAPAICRQGTQEWESAPPRVAVVDDVGAGDTFDAGFIHLWLRKAKVEDCLAFANIAAAYSVTREGGTEAFRDRSGLAQFVRKYWDESNRPLPVSASEMLSVQIEK